MDRETFTATIQAFQNRKPFKPFTVALVDGVRYAVDRPKILPNVTGDYPPVLRNIGRPLTTDVVLLGKPRELYADTLHLLNEVAEGCESAGGVLLDTVRILVQMRDARLARLAQLQSELRAGAGALPLSSEAIVALIRQHLTCKHSSRLPVLVVAAAYQAVADQLGDRPLPLQAHNAADEQTGAAGDVEVTLENDDRVCTVYEMKQKVVTLDDLDRAVQKVAGRPHRIDNYVVITTDRIDPAVSEYAATLYESTAAPSTSSSTASASCGTSSTCSTGGGRCTWMRISRWCWINRTARSGCR